MLRYHKFTAGIIWLPEYGHPQQEKYNSNLQFEEFKDIITFYLNVKGMNFN
mgnify:CR=1 FL=1